MAISDLEKIVARVSWIIGARDTAFDDTTADDRFLTEEIQRAVLETEADVVRALCEGYHPMRLNFLDWSSDLNNEDPVPSHLGDIEAVRIKAYSGGSYELAEATSRSNIKDWRDNTGLMFDALAHDANGSSLAGYFNLTNETITFTGYRAQVKICDYTPDYDTPELQVDAVFDGALVAGTIPRLNKLGVPQSLVMTYAGLYTNLLTLIRVGMQSLPALPDVQRVE